MISPFARLSLATLILASAPALFAETPATVASAGEKSPEKNPAWPDLEEVVVCWKCHLDIGYTHTVPEVIAKYRGHDMDALLSMFDKTKDQPDADRFRWMLPAWAMETVLDKEQTPERREKLEQAVRDNRLMWHAIPFTFESDAADLEELVRGLGYGSRLSRRFGVPLPKDAKQTDMPEQAWVMPTLLKKAGVDFIHIGANSGSKPSSELRKIPVLSWWEGADGSRVLLGYSPEYGWDSIVPPKGWKHKVWLAFFVRNDNAGPPSPAEVERILAEGHKKLPGVKIRFGRPSDFSDAIVAEEKARPTLPVIRADMPDTWCHGQMSTPAATGIHRRAAPLLGTLGQLDTTLRSLGLATDPVAPLLEDGYRNGGFYAEHTWGVNGYFRGSYGEAWKKKFEAGEFKKSDATYEYHMDYGRKAMADALDGVGPRMKALASSVKADGPRVVVFNPLPWTRDASAEVEVNSPVVAVTDAATGLAVPFEQDGATLRLAAKALPAGGYATFLLKTGDRAPVATSGYAGGRLETSRFTARFDLQKGGLASLVDKTTGRELVAPGGHALGQFVHERFSLDQVRAFTKAYARVEAGGWVWNDFGKGGMPDAKTLPYSAITPGGWAATALSTAFADTVRLVPADTRGLARGYELTFTFPKGADHVDIGWRVTNKTPDTIPEGGWICLPFNVDNPAFRVGRVGGTIDPAKDIGFGADRNLLTVDRGITVRAGDGGAGVGVASSDLPLWSLGKPGLWLYEPGYTPTKGEVFANLYNNMWNTNYPLWVGGSWSASLRLRPVASGESEEKSLFTPAWELRQHAVAAFADGTGGELPLSAPGVALSRRGTRVTAFCPNPDGDGVVLRLWEQSGVSGDITVTLPAGLKATKARPVNLRGEPAGEPLTLREGRFTTPLGAWAPVSFVLE